MIALHTFSVYPLTLIVLIPNLVSETKVESPLDYSLNSFLGFRFKTVIDEQLKLGRLTSVMPYFNYLLLVIIFILSASYFPHI
jgi:hypothetical protein